MKACIYYIAIVLTSFLAGCSSSKNTNAGNTTMNNEEAAAYHMKIADSLMTNSTSRKAATEYLLITKQYSSTKLYAEAAYKMGVLYSNPKNQVANDSIALHWFRVYVKLHVPDEQKEKAFIYIGMLERIKQLKDELQKLREVDVQVNERRKKK